MPPLDDLSPLKEKQFSEAVEKLEELMTQSGRAFLLGAGCSRCAGLPLASQLTEEALKSPDLNSTTKEILQEIESNFAGASFPNIEDYLSELVDLIAIAERRSNKSASKKEVILGGKTFPGKTLIQAAEEIKRAIYTVIARNITVGTHVKFVRAVHRPIRPGKAIFEDSVDYLVLNYDTLIEDALALEKIPYADGIDGGATGWWNPSTFDRKGLCARVIKLHGSIDWTELEGETLPRRIPQFITDHPRGSARIVIWPASTKYRETQRDPYAQLANIARAVLRPPGGSQRVLIICGYKFGDSHINLEIDRALRESDGRLTVVVFWSEADLDPTLNSWHTDKTVREQLLVFGKGGFWHADKREIAKCDLPWWKFENVTRLLGGER